MLTGTPRAYQSCALTKGGSGVDATLICALIHRCDPAGSVTAAAGTAVRASSCIRFLRKSGSDAARIIVTSPLVGPFEAYVIAYPSIATIAQLPQNPCLHAPTANSVCQAVIQRCLNERRGCADSGRLRLRFVTTAAVAEYIGWSIQQVCCQLRSHPTLRCRSLAYREFVAGSYVVWSLAFLKLPTGS